MLALRAMATAMTLALASPASAQEHDAGAPCRIASGCEHGSLQINTRPWARVWVDGIDTGLTTPVTLRVTAGRHRVRLVTRDGTAQELDVVVIPRQVHALRRDLSN